MKVLKYLFYRVYQLMISVGNGDIAAFASVMFMTAIIEVNITTLNCLFYTITGSKLNVFPKSNIVLTGFVLSIALILYGLLVYNGKLSAILKQYENESRQEKVRGRIVVIAYIVLSFAILLCSFFLMMARDK